MLQILTLAVVSVLLAGSALARPVVGADRYIPTVHEVNRVVDPIGYTVETTDIVYETWDAAATFYVPGDSAPIYELLLAASVLPTVDAAEEFFQEEAKLLASNNESAQVRTPYLDEILSADDARDLRVIFIGPWTGRRISSYMRLVQVDNVVALVEATGSPEADDHGAVDNDRALIVERLTDLVLVKVHEATSTRSSTDQVGPARQVSALPVSVACGSSGIGIGLRRRIGSCDPG